jgi:hypothetical protein
MKHIKTFESFVYESADLSPEAKIALAIKASQDKIKSLRQEAGEKPEMREFIAAKIKVEMEKLDVIMANKMLIAAKEKEEARKAAEKARKEKEKK